MSCKMEGLLPLVSLVCIVFTLLPRAQVRAATVQSDTPGYFK